MSYNLRIMTDEGQGARKLKSLKFTGGDILTKPFILVFMSNCIKSCSEEKPATQHVN